MPVALTFTPRLMPAPQAAHYVGVSQSKLRTAKIPRKIDGGKFLYDRLDLDQYADELPYEGESGDVKCDEADEAFA